MSYYFPEGSKLFFSNTFASPKTVTGVSNAHPAVATSVAHGFADGDELLFTSGWEDATDSVFKADQLTADTLGLLGLNTLNQSFFPAGTGTGTLAKVSNWTEMPQVLGISPSGGDARFTTISPLAKRNDINVPTGFNAMSLTITMGHDPDNANYQTMVDISRTLSKVAFKLVLSGGATAYGYGYMSVSEVPQMSKGQANQVNAAITFLGRFISYGS
ncbi:MAG: phage tail tube protein [Aquabacterium sp.]|jgi:hypothetical protein|uniref:phage tail tube protein n=1 Tax=Aquabacterium sp. TaxID=1872578 RepID=UPI002A35DAE2|nr:phage tail tube protein [Aquabacterium sp.]MDX9843924.1 phage tail tube protein [Aquabacterium sp.]